MPAIISHLIARREKAAVKAPEREVSPAQKWQHVHRFGETPLAFPALTETDLHTFGDERGMITYGRKMGVVFALSDPLANASDSAELMDEFIETFGDPVFVACTERGAKLAESRGYLVNVLGHDTDIDLPSHSFAGGAQKRIRYAQSWLERLGAHITEAPDVEFGKENLLSVSEAWHETRVANREVAFLNRALSLDDKPLVRRFYAISSTGDVLGFSGFDPVFRDGNVVGYLASTKRRVPENTAYLDLAIMAHAIRTFKEEGLEKLYLGISPLADTSPSGFAKESRLLRQAFRLAFKSDFVNRRFFNFRGLAEYKGRFKGEQTPLYICLPNHGSNILRLLGFLILTKIV